MKKSKLLLILLITNFQIGITANAQKVSNISFRQEQSTIIVSYDLETKTPCKVSLYVSTNGGVKWQGPLTKVTGDVGNKIVSGSKNIIWNVLDEFKELKGVNIKFQVRVSNEIIQTVKIGSQIWTLKNLDVSTFSNGDIIPEVKDIDKLNKLSTAAWCYYDNDPKNGEIYGKLYNWYAVNDPRGLSPKGFHIPSDREWNTLINYLGDDVGYKMKEKGSSHWIYPNLYSNNSSGFTGLPAGHAWSYANGTISFFDLGEKASFWVFGTPPISYPARTIIQRYILDTGGGVPANSCQTCYYSVRCIKD